MVHLYASLSDLTDRLCISDHDRDLALANCLEAASRWIEHETARRFYVVVPDPLATPAGETRYYTAAYVPGGRSYPWNLERPSGGIALPHRISVDDVVTVTRVATDEDGDGTYERVWTVGTDYWLGPRNAIVDGKPYRFLNLNQVTGRYIWPSWENAIAVTGSFGYSTATPGPIRDVCLMVAEVLARPVLDLALVGVESYKIGSDLSIKMKPEDFPPSVQLILQDYKDPLFS